jgi:hypothetical protein
MVLNKHSRRHFLKVGGGLLIGATTAGSFPLIRTLAAGRPTNILRFQFVTERGEQGSFFLNTDTESTGFPGTFGTEYLYFSAVFGFSFIGLDNRIKHENAGWKVVPGLSAQAIGLPPGTPGVLSGVNYPDGCSTGTANFCSITVAVLYLGDVVELLNLSPNPNSYQVVGVDIFESNGEVMNRIRVTNSKVIALPKFRR